MILAMNIWSGIVGVALVVNTLLGLYFAPPPSPAPKPKKRVRHTLQRATA